MAVLIIKNHHSEGPGTIGDFLKKEDIPFRIVELSSGEIPPPLEDFDTLVIMGGPMGVYELDQYPHLRVGSRLIRESMNRGMKVFGICLGAQMLAYCLGARVFKGSSEEIGWHSIELTGDGLKDPLMRKLATHPSVRDFWKQFKVLQWHGDTFELPIGAILLAKSGHYQNQAFRYGENIYGFQFHIEVTKSMILEWFDDRPDTKKIIEETESVYEEYSGRANNFYSAFFKK
jgi:GMP synthase (glutamine-hydrolysing)